MKLMRGFIQLPIIIIILLLVGGAITAYSVGHKLPVKKESAAQVNSTASASASVQTINPSPKPLSTPTIAQINRIAPTAYPTPTTATIGLNSNSSVKLESLNPTSGIQNQTITLHGQNFGSSVGKVWFYSSQGVGEGGPPIDKWSDTEIQVKVGFMLRGNNTFYLEIITADGQKSNKLPFTVTAGQPYIASVSPTTFTRSGQVTIQGTEFGSSTGSVRFYTATSTSWNGILSGTGNITSWSDTSITFTVPSNLDTKEYAFIIATSDGRETSARYFTISN